MDTYRQLIQTARSLERTELLSREVPLTDEEIAEFLQANKPHLDAARAALSQECHVELEYSEDFFGKHMDDVGSVRRLAWAFRVELTAAEQDGRWNDAVRAGVSGLDLAGAVRRGGLVTDMLIAAAISGISTDALRRFRHQLGIDELRHLIGELERVEAQREPIAAIVERDEDWERRFPPKEEFDPSKMEWPEGDGDRELDEETRRYIVAAIAEAANQPREARVQTYLDADHRESAFLRLLAVEAALLAFQRTHGAFPESLDALQPVSLKTVPLDPYVDEPFRYRRDGDGFVLYSVGPSRKDSGGRKGSWATIVSAGADLFLDASDYEDECG